MPELPSSEVLAEMLDARYGLGQCTLHPLPGSSRVHRVDLRGGDEALVLRTYPEGGGEVPARQDADLLLFLERKGYPAPRLVRAADGAPFTSARGFLALATTYVTGRPPGYCAADLRQIGEALGRLHAMRAAPGDPALRPAGMRVIPEVAWALSRLAQVLDRTPPALRGRHAVLEAALRAIPDRQDLPQVLIHNDAHPGNAVLLLGGGATFVDWEGAGLGPAALDLAFLLISCDTQSPWTPRLVDDPDRVPAVLDGYCSHRIPSKAEIDRLADLMRFRTLVFGACAFADAVIAGRPEGGETSWWWARYGATDIVAERARAHLLGGR